MKNIQISLGLLVILGLTTADVFAMKRKQTDQQQQLDEVESFENLSDSDSDDNEPKEKKQRLNNNNNNDDESDDEDTIELSNNDENIIVPNTTQATVTATSAAATLTTVTTTTNTTTSSMNSQLAQLAAIRRERAEDKRNAELKNQLEHEENERQQKQLEKQRKAEREAREQKAQQEALQQKIEQEHEKQKTDKQHVATVAELVVLVQESIKTIQQSKNFNEILESVQTIDEIVERLTEQNNIKLDGDFQQYSKNLAEKINELINGFSALVTVISMNPCARIDFSINNQQKKKSDQLHKAVNHILAMLGLPPIDNKIEPEDPEGNFAKIVHEYENEQACLEQEKGDEQLARELAQQEANNNNNDKDLDRAIALSLQENANNGNQYNQSNNNSQNSSSSSVMDKCTVS